MDPAGKTAYEQHRRLVPAAWDKLPRAETGCRRLHAGGREGYDRHKARSRRTVSQPDEPGRSCAFPERSAQGKHKRDPLGCAVQAWRKDQKHPRRCKLEKQIQSSDRPRIDGRNLPSPYFVRRRFSVLYEARNGQKDFGNIGVMCCFVLFCIVYFKR